MRIEQQRANVETLRKDYIRIANLVGQRDPRSEAMRETLAEAVISLQDRKYENVVSMLKLQRQREENTMTFELQDKNVETLYQDFIRMGFLCGWEDSKTTAMRKLWESAENKLEKRLKEGN